MRKTSDPLGRKTSQKGNRSCSRHLVLPIWTSPFPENRMTLLTAVFSTLPLPIGSSVRTPAWSCHESSYLRTVCVPYSFGCSDLKRLWWQEINLSKLLYLDWQLRGLRDISNMNIFLLKCLLLFPTISYSHMANN